MISLMAKRFIHTEWPSLVPVINYFLIKLLGTYLAHSECSRPYDHQICFRGFQKDLQKIQVHVQIRRFVHGNELYD